MFGHNWHRPKIGGCVTYFLGWAGPHLTQRLLGQGLPPQQVACHNGHGPKIGSLSPFSGEGEGGRAGSPSNTMWPGPRSTSVPSFILMHQPFGHNAPTSHTDRQTYRTDRAGQRSDSIGQTVFGWLFVKRFALCYQSVVCLSVTLVYCGQTVGWIKMKLGMEVGFGPGHIVLDEDPSPKQGGQQPPLFCPCLLWPNGWMDQDATWYGGRHRPWPHCFRWRPSFPPPKKKNGHRPQFSAHVYCGQTVAHLSYCWALVQTDAQTDVSM